MPKQSHKKREKEYNFTYHGCDGREQELEKEDNKRNNKRNATPNTWGCSSYAMPMWTKKKKDFAMAVVWNKVSREKGNRVEGKVDELA